MAQLRIKRVQEEPADDDGRRILVDRLWPRGLSKERVACDDWLKDVGPSTELRTWFGHDPARFEQFAERYRAELDASAAARQLRSLLRGVDSATLLYSAQDEQHNQAVVLLAWLRAHRSGY